MGPLDATTERQTVVCGQRSAVRISIQRDRVRSTSLRMTGGQGVMQGMKAWGEGEASEEVFVVVKAATDESDGGEIQGDGHRETVEVKSARLDINQMLG